MRSGNRMLFLNVVCDGGVAVEMCRTWHRGVVSSVRRLLAVMVVSIDNLKTVWSLSSLELTIAPSSFYVYA